MAERARFGADHVRNLLRPSALLAIGCGMKLAKFQTTR